MSATCPACGELISSPGRFCPSCGAPIAPVSAGRETRKIVTVLFADITGSTEMGERLDPEAVRTLLGRHFARARSILERHGGTVEKFIGDAVMAVFGVPTVHEDDALRAVRAALELQASVDEVNRDPSVPSAISIRIGVNTGEVVTGQGGGETLVTGDTVNTAARLEQAASVGEILVGIATYELVRDAVEAAPPALVSARGKSEPVEAVRVMALVGAEGRRRKERGEFIGRAAELATLAGAFERATSGTPGLITVLAPAGVGKSRLIREFATGVRDSATVVKGRCLPYGEGITYWPIREVVHQLAGVKERHSPAEVRARVRELVAGQAEVLDSVAAVVGLEAPPQRQEEIFWGVRRLLERAAAPRPLVLLVEDLHWAEETLLDLLEYVIAMATVPFLVVATSRPDLLDARPTWGSTGSLLRLEPLTPTSAEELLLAQDGASGLPGQTRRRILEAADGNPLFLEEMMAMLRERGTADLGVDDVAIPGTVKALLAARLDQLVGEERTVLQHGAVIGRSFEAPAVAEMVPVSVGDRLTRILLTLVRRELLRPERAELTDGDAYRFRHILIRDAAYHAMAKLDRAVLHERFADWLETVAGERTGEFEEIIGYHLAQAVAYRQELGEGELDALTQRSASWLLRAGLRAVRRDDRTAAVTLLRNAADFGRNIYETESAALRELVDLYQDAGEFARAEEATARALKIAEDARDHRFAAIARIQRLFVHRHTQPTTWVEEANSVAPEAIAILEREGDELGISHGWHALALAAYPDLTKITEYGDRAYDHARAAGEARQLGWTMASLATRILGDETPVSEALPLVKRLLAEAQALGRLFVASIELDLAVLEAMAGNYEVGVARAEAARAVHREFGHHMELAMSAGSLVLIHEFGGEFGRAEPAVREAVDFLATTGDQDLGPYLAAHLARILAVVGRFDEARALVERAHVDDADSIRELVSRSAMSHILSAEGRASEAIAMARGALALVPPNSPNRRASTLMDLAQALRADGRHDGARTALKEAAELAERKGNVGLLAVIERQLQHPAATEEFIERDA